MRVRRDISPHILPHISPWECREKKRGVRSGELLGAITCLFLCSLLAALPAFADGVEADQKAHNRLAASSSGAATSSVPGKPQDSQADQSNRAQQDNTKGEGATEEKGPKLSDFDLARYQYCGEDSDCVVELNGCCQCETGAQEVAINKNRVEAFRSQFVGCAEVSCGPITASEHCGGGVVSCIEHRCRFFPADEGI